MKSRMDRYKNSTTTNKRSNKNEDLYRTIYDSTAYSNIEGVAKMDKTNEVDITRIKEMLKSRENYRKQKEYEKIMNKQQEATSITDRLKDLEDSSEFDDKNYDIRDILVKAKEEKPDDKTNQYRNLKNTQYNILKNLELKDSLNKQTEDMEVDNILNELTDVDDNELSLDLLNDLKGSNTLSNTTSSPTVKEILKEAKDYEISKKKDSLDEIDKSFFTSSFNFTDADFEDIKEMHKSVKKNNKLVKILIFIMIVALLSAAILVVYNLLK